MSSREKISLILGGGGGGGTILFPERAVVGMGVPSIFHLVAGQEVAEPRPVQRA